MFETFEWKITGGKGNPEDLTLLSLSTCGFCSSAKKYLNERGLAFRYLELDMLAPEIKSEIKEEFRAKFGRRPSFPSLVIGKEKYLVGFVRGHWEDELGQGDEPS
jgi:glutaredoxin